MKSLVLRFDIDTPRCLRQGVPNLLRLAREEGVRFTFFCNMGRAISRRFLLKKLLRRSRPPRTAPQASKLPVFAKQGIRQAISTLVLNPLVGMSHPEVLRRAHDDGHDIGLHGGNNHGEWQYGFHSWSRDHIRREVDSGRRMFETVLKEPPILFSSPGWQGSDELNAILKSMGFRASADRHGLEENNIVRETGLYTFPTNLVAEPGGVAYLESLAALGYSPADAIDRFNAIISDDRRLYVLYDHPCFAGVAALETVRGILQCARENGLTIFTFSDLLQPERRPELWQEILQ